MSASLMLLMCFVLAATSATAQPAWRVVDGAASAALPPPPPCLPSIVPANVSVLNATWTNSSALNVTWSPPSGSACISSYTVNVTDARTSSQARTVQVPANTTHLLLSSFVTNDHDYTVSVAAVAMNGSRGPAASINVAGPVGTSECATPLGPVTGLAASAVSSTSAQLSWAPSAGNCPATGYRIQWSTDSVTSPYMFVSSVNVLISDLPAGASVVFEVSAVTDAAGTGAAASTTVALPCSLGAVTSPSASPVDSTDASVSWNAPSAWSCGGGISYYLVTVTDTTTGLMQQGGGPQTQQTPDVSIVISGLTPSHTYSFDIQACSDDTGCGPSSSASVEMPSGGCTPAAVLFLTGTANTVSANGGTVSWLPPLGACPISAYKVVVASSFGLIVETQQTSDTSATFTDWSAGATYVVSVSALGPNGEQGAASTARITVPAHATGFGIAGGAPGSSSSSSSSGSSSSSSSNSAFGAGLSDNRRLRMFLG